MRRRHTGAGPAARISVFAIASVLLLSLLAIVPAGVVASGTQFGPYQVTPIGSEPEAVAIGDVTSDGIADIVLTTGSTTTPPPISGCSCSRARRTARSAPRSGMRPLGPTRSGPR